MTEVLPQYKLPTMLTIQEAADKTGISTFCIRGLARSGKIACVTSGRKYYINLEKFIEYLNSNTAPVDKQEPVVDNRFGITKIKGEKANAS